MTTIFAGFSIDRGCILMQTSAASKPTSLFISKQISHMYLSFFVDHFLATAVARLVASIFCLLWVLGQVSMIQDGQYY